MIFETPAINDRRMSDDGREKVGKKEHSKEDGTQKKGKKTNTAKKKSSKNGDIKTEEGSFMSMSSKVKIYTCNWKPKNPKCVFAGTLQT